MCSGRGGGGGGGGEGVVVRDRWEDIEADVLLEGHWGSLSVCGGEQGVSRSTQCVR